MAVVPKNADETFPEKSTERFNLRATPSDAALIRQAAFARHQSVTEFMLQVSLATAREVLEDDHAVTVPADVFKKLQDELSAPGTPIAELAKLITQSSDPKRKRNF